MLVMVMDERRTATGSLSMSPEPWSEIPGSDVRVVTSRGESIPAHSNVLASISPVLEHIIDLGRGKKGWRGDHKVVVIPILGVPDNAVFVFLRCLYSSRHPEEDEMEKHGVHLLVLCHVMRVDWLKKAATAALVGSTSTENVVDMLQLARQCDAPRLRVRCMNLIRREYKAVEQTEGWQFLQKHDPWLELEVLQFLQEVDKREKRRMRIKREQTVYMDLAETMECLSHICTEGCTMVGPRHQSSPPSSPPPGPCRWGGTCESLQQVIRHFAVCERKKKRWHASGGNCLRCSRMWQLLRLHSAVCDESNSDEPCMVPLCKRFKQKEAEKKREDTQWTLLTKKVVSARIMSTLSMMKAER